ncbi:hypothetical protein [Oryzobacter terrae]|uniref:hypothetical protein n=1 Tax=Oryzobacter terrae TaxID=1620385 RepID=UPI00366BBBC5
MAPAPLRALLGRLAGTAVAAGLVLTGFVATAGPASAAACSGTSGVTVVVDTGSSTSTRCASGDPSSAWKALTAAGYAVTPVQQFPGAICRIDGYPSNQACVRMPPADAYWAFFHAARGGSWTYSSSGATSHDPAPGTVVGFRFGSGQKPRSAPPATSATSTPKPTPKPTVKATPKPQPRTTAPRPTAAAPRTSVAPSRTTTTSSARPTTGPSASASPSATASASPSATATPSASTSVTANGSQGPTPVAAAATGSDGSGGPGTLLAGGALVALVAGAGGWAAWKRRA